MTRVLGKFMHQQLDLAFGMWLMWLEEEKRQKQLLSRVAARMMHSSLWMAVRHWIELAREILKSRVMLLRVKARWANGTLSRAFNSWATETAHANTIRKRMMQVFAKWHERMLNAAYQRWASWLEKEKRLARRRARAGLVLRVRAGAGEGLHPDAAIAAVRAAAAARFDESVDVALQLGVDPRKPAQNIRGVSPLPFGTGKAVNIAVFARGERAEEARDEGEGARSGGGGGA
jgi:hypothetical protein